MVPSLIIIEPIVVVITVGVLLLDQPLHLLLSSSTTGLREWCHIVSSSVIQQKASSNAIRILFFNKTITEEGLARLGQSLKLWGHLPIPPAIGASKEVIEVVRGRFFWAILLSLGVWAML